MTRTDKEIRSAVRASYATIAVDEASCCSPGEAEAPDIGYDPADRGPERSDEWRQH